MIPSSGRQEPSSSLPNWAQFFEPEEYAAFDRAVQQYFKSLGNPFKIDDGTVRTKWIRGESEMQNLGLLNVAQLCKQGKVEDYPAIVQNHFEVMRKSQDFIAGFFDNMGDFEFVKPFLGTRLYHKDHVKSIGAGGIISRPVAEDIIAMLVFDMPQAISSVKPEQIQVWGRSAEELFELGLGNIRESYPFHVMDLETPVPLKAVIQDHFFGSNIILDMERHPELLGKHGSLVAVPHRHSTLFHPIEDISVISATQLMIHMVHGMHKEGPGSISPHLYWYKQGEFLSLPYKMEVGSVQFMPPQEFEALLSYLAAEEN